MAVNSFDVVIASDFRFTGGTATAIAHELDIMATMDLRVGLLPVSAPFFAGMTLPQNPAITDRLDQGKVVLIPDDGQPWQTTLLLAEHPAVFRVPPVHASPRSVGLCLIIVHHVPLTADGRLTYDLWRIHQVCRRAFQAPVVWAPISALCRTAVRAVNRAIPILADTWSNLIMVDDWGRPREADPSRRPVIGRHSRPDLEKWPDPEVMRQAYPASDQVDVALLGYNTALDTRYGPRPSNWTCLSFNEVPVRDFLQTIDFFVYYHSAGFTETFGRTTAEAIASGAVAILPPYMAPNFGDAALYREPDRVLETVHQLWRDPPAYAAQSRTGRDRLAALNGPDPYRRVLGRVLEAAQVGDVDGLLETGIATPSAATVLSLRTAHYGSKVLEKGKSLLRQRFRRG